MCEVTTGCKATDEGMIPMTTKNMRGFSKSIAMIFRFKRYLLRFYHKNNVYSQLFISVMCQLNDSKSKVNEN